MKDLGELHHFLGMQVQCNSEGLFLSQHQYMIDILSRAGMTDCKPVSTPVECNPKLSTDGVPVQDATDFRSLAGALPLPGQILLMRFSRSVSICMILESRILSLSSRFYATSEALFISGFSYDPLRRLS